MTDKPTLLKDALKKWEEETGEMASEAKEIGLQFQMPPLEKMDIDVLSKLEMCEKLSLSSNCIEKILMPPLMNLKILSLARNNIKSLAGLEPLGDTLEELWISYNQIEKLKGIELMKKLKVFYISFNLISSWNELSKVSALEETLETFSFIGNPLAESLEEEIYREEAIKRLPFLTWFDGDLV